jgi:hypothetical protein
MSAAIALAASSGRIGWGIQNQGTNHMAILMHNTENASATVFHKTLAAGTVNDNGTAGAYAEMSGDVWQGRVTVFGVALRYTVIEYFDV